MPWKRNTKQVDPRFKIERNRVIFAKWLGGKSARKIAIDYELSNTAVSYIIGTYARYASLGLVNVPEPIYD